MAIIEFRSKADGGFFMLEDSFRAVCKVLQRPYSVQGCIAPQDLAQAIGLLEQEIETERRNLEQKKAKRLERERASGTGFLSFEQEEQEKEAAAREKEAVSFAIRTFPLLEMLRRANKKQVNVFWGVP